MMDTTCLLLLKLLLLKMDYHYLKIIKKLLQTSKTTNCYHLKYRYFSRPLDK